MTVRDDLVAWLRAIVGPESAVHIIPFQDNMDVPDRPTIMLKQTGFRPLPAGPRAGLQVDYVLTFIAPEIDPSAAEEYLDKWCPETMFDMSNPAFVWTDAQKVVVGPVNTGYDVACYVIGGPENTPLPATVPAAEPQAEPVAEPAKTRKVKA